MKIQPMNNWTDEQQQHAHEMINAVRGKLHPVASVKEPESKTQVIATAIAVKEKKRNVAKI